MREANGALLTGVLSLLLVSGLAAGFAVSSDEVHVSSHQHESPTTSQTSDPSEPQSAIHNPPSAIQLVPGVPIERELAGGEAHAYQIALVSGQYLRVVVDQRGINVVVRLLGPDGQQLAEMDSAKTTRGQESISVVAETSGDYRPEVRAFAKEPAHGRYEIRIEALRAATPEDTSRVTAQRLFIGAEQLRANGAAESLREAIEKYDEARRLWQMVGDSQAEATALLSIGVVYYLLGENREALDYYNQALSLFRAVGDRVGEAATLNRIGKSYYWLDEYQTAMEYYNQALPLWRDVGDRAGEASTLNNVGLVYHNLYEDERALGYYNQALVLWRAVGDRAGEAGTLDNMGGVYHTFGEELEAFKCMNQALSIFRELGDRRGEANMLTGISAIHSTLGDRQKALDCHEQALQLWRVVGDRIGEATALDHTGGIYHELGEEQKALDSYNQALPIWQAVGRRLGEGGTLTHIGWVYADLGDYQKALDYLTQAAQIMRSMGNPFTEARTLYDIARVERDRGNLVEARSRIEAALALMESRRTKLAKPDLPGSYAATLQWYYEFYIDLLMRLHQRESSTGHDAAALEAGERARARSLLLMLAEAHADIRQGVDPELLERERRVQQQVSAKEQDRMKLLSGKPTQEQAAAVEKELDILLTEYREVERQIRTRSPRYAALTQPQPLSLKEIQQQVLDEDTLLLEYALGEERSFLWAVTPTSISSFELPKRTEIETAARRVYDLLTARNQRVKFETKEEKRARVAKVDAEYTKAAAALSQMLLEPVAGQLGKKRLLVVSDGALQYVPFAALPKPDIRHQTSDIRPETKDKGQGTRDKEPLIVDHEIISLPSASVLAVLRRELAGRKPAAKTVAVLADPVFQSNDPRVKRMERRRDDGDAARGRGGDTATVPASPRPPVSASLPLPLSPSSDLERSVRDTGVADGELRIPRLPFTRQEAEGIMALAAKGAGLKAVDFDANRATATNTDLSQYRIVHFATHGLLNSQHPELSGVVLSLLDEQAQPQDGFLRAHEIYNLNLPAELVVLSGCKTGLGKEIKGEGLVGLTRGFMYAGAARVVVSLWDVNDVATAELMKRFYQKMLAEGQRPAAALRAAQVAMWKEKRWQAPYYWAAFMLQGEWR
jgi:CHAT domain-containing protein/tetratricopeptide (TPR) repeat protein